MSDASLEEWRALYQSAAVYRTAAPWRCLGDTDLFALENPADGSFGYCSVLGMADEEFGLAVFLGDEGLTAYRGMMSEDLDTDGLAILDSLRSLSATFVDRPYIEPRDRRVIDELGLKFRGRNAWPLFRSQQPGYLPWSLERDEVLFLDCSLRAAIAAAEFVQSGDLSLDELGIGSGRIVALGHDGGNWRREWRMLPPEREPEPLPPVDELSLRRLSEKPRRRETWEAAFSVLPAGIGNPTSRQQYVSALLAVDGDGMILALKVMEPGSSDAERQAEFAGVLEAAPALPATIRVPTAQTRRVLQQLADGLKLKLVVGGTPQLDEAMGGLLDYLAR